jgi:ATP-binding protein involved in chromosome partitioning
LLGRIPLDPLLRECGDAGEPLMVAAPESETAQELLGIAESLAALGAGTIVKPLTVLS